MSHLVPKFVDTSKFLGSNWDNDNESLARNLTRPLWTRYLTFLILCGTEIVWKKSYREEAGKAFVLNAFVREGVTGFNTMKRNVEEVFVCGE